MESGNEVHAQSIDNISFTGTQYSVPLPWKVGHNELPSNDLCLARLTGLLRKLRKDPHILGKYDEIINNQLESGIIQRGTQLEPTEKVHYLAYHAFIQEEAGITKVRNIF